MPSSISEAGGISDEAGDAAGAVTEIDVVVSVAGIAAVSPDVEVSTYTTRNPIFIRMTSFMIGMLIKAQHEAVPGCHRHQQRPQVQSRTQSED